MIRRIPRWLTYERVLLAIIFIGVVVRTIAWLGRSEFWLDEVAVAKNIEERSLGQLLFVPLDYGQAAPKGFLLLQWIVTHLLGTSEVAYRLVPFIAGVASLFFFKRIVTRVLGGASAALILLVFAVGQPFIWFSAEAKQYALDLALSLWMIALTIEARDEGFPRPKVMKLAIAGFIAVWFSQFTIITLAALGVSLVLLELRHGVRATVSRLAPIGLLWGVGAALATVVSLKSMFPATDGYMHWFHEANMPPWPPKTKADYLWLWTRMRPLVGTFHGWDLDDLKWTTLYQWLAVVGLVALAIRRRGTALLVIAPLVLAIIVVTLRQYPLASRLWLVPTAMLIIGVGECLRRLLTIPTRAGSIAGAVLAALIVALPVVRLFKYPPPYVADTLGAHLKVIRQRWQPGDRIFAPATLSLQTDYYAGRLGFREGTDYMHATCSRKVKGVWDTVYDSLDRLRGEPRVWLLTGGNAVAGRGPQEFQYAKYMGVFVDSVMPRIRGSFGGASTQPFNRNRAFLFDLSDSARLAERSRASWNPPPRRGRGILNRQQGDPRWCYGVFMPHTRESQGETPEVWTPAGIARMKKLAAATDSAPKGASRPRAP